MSWYSKTPGRAARIARDTGAALHIVHVLQVAALDQVRHLLAGAPADLRTRLESAAGFALNGGLLKYLGRIERTRRLGE